MPVKFALRIAICLQSVEIAALPIRPAARAASSISQAGGSCRILSDTFLACSIYSRQLQKQESFALHLPTDWPQARQKVLLFLHGAGRNSLTLFSEPASRPVINKSDLVIIFPNGNLSWWADTKQGKYETYAIELFDQLITLLRLPRETESHAVGGWSMGGFGSLRLAENHPEHFAAWAALIALADFPNPAYPPSENYPVPALLGPPARWPKVNPIHHLAALRGKSIWFATGTSAFDRSMNINLDRQLTLLAIPHQFRLTDGAHDFHFVGKELPDLFAFLEARLR